MFAVVGVALRLPGGVSDLEQLWDALKSGKDLVGQVEEARWPVSELRHPDHRTPGRSVTFDAGVLPDVGGFDAEFFGISPREASYMDPQQRLLLELAWESLEDAGIPASKIKGSRTGVFVGISGVDYGMRALDDLASMGPHSMTGNTLSIAANRLSYIFDLHGPSLAIDTACSSAMVALHQACNSLRLGESEMALVGGVNLLLHPYSFVGFSKAQMLSPRGRCRAFDASGDGYVRAEGGAVLLLKPLEKALTENDRIHAVILGTGANADGRRKTGLTIPSAEAQAELMADVLARSGMEARDVCYIEAHGTGTAVGDPIEARAIGRVYGAARSDAPLPVGSIKTHVGHLEPASGLAGLLKAILVLHHREIPGSLHLEQPNPDIPFEALAIEPVANHRALQVAPGRPAVVGVNSFGFGGANAHVLLQSPPSFAAREAPADVPPLLLSARNEASLRRLAGDYANLIGSNETRYYDIAYGAYHRREHLDCRLLARADSVSHIRDALSRYANDGVAEADLVQVLGVDGSSLPAFVYTGNGAQWHGMARTLMQESPGFSRSISEVDVLIQRHSGLSVRETLLADEADSGLERTEVAQPVLFAIQVGLTELLRGQGVRPAAVTGHSVGEVAAAWAAGCLTLEQAVEVICKRSSAQALARGSGRMAAVALSEQAVRERLVGRFEQIEIAGINSAGNCTLSGSEEAIHAFAESMHRQGVFCVVLDLDYAFHSAAMDAIRGPLLDSLNAFSPTPSDSGITFVSTVSGTVHDAPLDAEYWWRNIRQPVRFAEACENLLQQGCGVLVEIGPRPILRHYLNETLAASGQAGEVLASMRPEADGLAPLIELASRVQALCPVSQLCDRFPVRGRWIDLPKYPWDKSRYWMSRTQEALGLFDRHRVHPLLGWRMPGPDPVWENVLDDSTCPWLVDHRVDGAIVFPGAGYVELCLAVGAQTLDESVGLDLESLDIVSPMVFEPGQARQIRVRLNARDRGIQILGRPRLSDEEWQLHAVARLAGPLEHARLDAFCDEGAGQPRSIDASLHYELTESVSLEYGPGFQCLSRLRLWQDERLLSGDLVLPQGLDGLADYRLYPGLLDACFQALVDLFETPIREGRGMPYVPVRIDRLRLRADRGVASRFRLQVRYMGARSLRADIVLLDDSNEIVALLEGCRFRAVPLGAAEQAPRLWVNRACLRPLDRPELACETPVVETLIEAVRKQVGEDGNDPVVHEYLPLIEGLVLALLGDAMQTLFQADRDRFGRYCDDPRQLPGSFAGLLFRWAVDRLREEKILVHEAGEWVINPADVPPKGAVWDILLREYPQALPELAPLVLAGERLADLFRGECPSASLSRQLIASVQQHGTPYLGPVGVQVLRGVEGVVARLRAEIKTGQRLRVLELGDNIDLGRRLLDAGDEDIQYVLACGEEADRTGWEDQTEVLSFGRWLAAEGHLELPGGTPPRFDLIVVRDAASALVARHALDTLKSRLVEGGLLLLCGRYPDDGLRLIELVRHADDAYLDQDWANQADVANPAYWQAHLAQSGLVDRAMVAEDDSVALGAWWVLGRNPDPYEAVMPESQGTWVLVQPARGAVHTLATALADHLAEREQQVMLMPYAEPRDLEDAVIPEGATQVVFLSGGQEQGAPDERDTVALLTCARRLGQRERPPQLWVVTQGGVLDADQKLAYPPNGEAALWGAGRVVANEFPALSLHLVDLDPRYTPEEGVARLVSECLRSDGVNEVALTHEGRFAIQLDVLSEQRKSPTEQQAYHLDFQVPGQLRNLVWTANPAPLAGEGQVEVEVVATGLNFRDVMYAMGMLPDEAVEKGFAGATLGLEFSGRVRRVGPGVTRFQAGDEVMGFGSACFSSHLVTREDALAHKPRAWTFEQAATVPTVFFTVYYALQHLARLQPGERVLIHGAAGGVGIAAIQLARHLGAEVHATAGSDEKRAFARLLGADHVYDSRSLSFADQLMEVTGGEGVDVVLNSLAGEAIRRNLRVLRPFGRFLELGKRDFFEDTPVGLRPFKDNISYFGIDADQLLVERPDLAGRLFSELMRLFESGDLYPLPYRVFDAPRIVDAFRTMQQARHIGKIVVRMADQTPHIESGAPAGEPLQLRGDASYLVTGGISGFGLATAKRLARRGAGQLILLGRRGMETPGAEDAVAQLKALGARVTVMACDVSDRRALAETLALVRARCLPLAGIVHAAMVLDDAFVTELDAARVRAVFAPKAWGAWYLHELTRDMPLDHFILYSSITTSIGNPGQANYVAANAFLEALAVSRRAQGLAATCIGWGPIGDVGYLTRHESVKDSLEAHLGAAPLSAREALDVLERILEGDHCVVAAARFSWPTLSRYLAASDTYRYALMNRHFGDARQEDSDDFQRQIQGKSADEIEVLVREVISGEIAEILGLSVDRIDSARSLRDMGLDSLMGAELVVALEQRVGIRLPMMLLTQSPSIDKIVAHLLAHLAGEQQVDDGAMELEDMVDVLAQQHGADLEEEHVAAMVDDVKRDVQVQSAEKRL